MKASHQIKSGKYPPMSAQQKLSHAAEMYADLAQREGSEQDRDAAAMLQELAGDAPNTRAVTLPIIERLRQFARFRPERLDFELLELMRDAINAITTEQTMHAAWRKRAEEAEFLRDGAPNLEEIARTIIERVAKDAVMLAITRSQLSWDKGLEQTEEEIAQDAVDVCTGDEMGCLDESNAISENSTHIFVIQAMRPYFPPASHFTGVEPEYLDATNHGSDMTVERLLGIVANGQTGKFGGEKLQQLADWIVAHRVSPASQTPTDDDLRKWCLERANGIEGQYGNCCGDMLNISAADLADELQEFGSYIIEKCATPASTARTHNALTLAKKCLCRISLHAPGYDWNGDPLNLTLDIGNVSQVIDAALKDNAPDLGPLAAPGSVPPSG